MIYLSNTKKQIPEEVWQARGGARFILQRKWSPCPRPPFSYPILLFPLTSSTPGGGACHFQATKAGHGQQALMFILADRPPAAWPSFVSVQVQQAPPTTTTPPTPSITPPHPPRKQASWGVHCVWPRVRGCPVLKPLTRQKPLTPPPVFPPSWVVCVLPPHPLHFTVTYQLLMDFTRTPRPSPCLNTQGKESAVNSSCMDVFISLYFWILTFFLGHWTIF